MSKLSHEARSIVDAGRAHDGPTPSDRHRNRGGVFARLGLGATAAGVATSTTSGAGAGTASAAAAGPVAGAAATGHTAGAGLLVVKLMAGLVLAGGMGVGAVRWRAKADASAVVAIGSVTAAASPLPVPGGATARGAVVGSPEGSPTQASVPKDPSIRAVGPRLQAPALGHEVDGPSASLSHDSLSDETRLLRSANDALVAADPAGALAVLDAYAARFPRGVLEEEHAAARAVALCDAKRDQGRPAATAFLRAYPRSPLAARVRLACDEKE